jgi:hypothetical protein
MSISTKYIIGIVFAISVLLIVLLAVNKCGPVCISDYVRGRQVSKFQDNAKDLDTATDEELKDLLRNLADKIKQIPTISDAEKAGLANLEDEMATMTREQLEQSIQGMTIFLFFAGMGDVNMTDAVMTEGFQNATASTQPDVLSKIQTDVGQLTPDELKATLEAMKQRLAKYGLLPGQEDLEIDRSQWVPKSNIPPAGPRIDMSEYVKKSSIPPEKVCPPQKEIDYSEYVKKSTLPPTQKCPPCISPKVKVSAGLCKKCPPCASCPPPQRCPELQCPEPKPCPKVECPKCDEIKYIKVPTIITRTVKVDASNNVISEQVEEANAMASSAAAPTEAIPQTTRNSNSQKAKTCGVVGLNSEFKQYGVFGLE